MKSGLNVSMALVALLLGVSVSAQASGGKTADTPAAKSAVKTFHCYRLKQKNVLFGECTVYASPQALKIVFTNGKFVNLCKAPDWQLYVINPREKIYNSVSLDKWQANKLQLDSMAASRKVELIETKETKKIAGLTAVKIVPAVRTGGNRAREYGIYWVARDIHLPDQISHVMCGNSLLPTLHKIPLSVSMDSAVLRSSLTTTAADEVDMPVSFFDLPKGMKYTSHHEDVMNTGVMDIVKDMTGF